MAVKPFVFGGLASLTAEFGTFPIDTTKTRLQVQGQVMDLSCSQLRYRGMVHAIFRIYQEEGLLALYSGIAPALLRQASYGTLKIGLYHYIKRAMDPDPQNETLLKNVVAGMASGAMASSIANPTDVLKVRMQAASSEAYAARRSCVHLFSHIYREEGVRGLYRGVVPTAQRAAGVAGVLLPSYDFFKRLLQDSGHLGDTTLTHFLSSFLAGLLGTMATNPLDVIKSRMMNQSVLKKSSTPAHIYTSSFNCFLTTLRTEGPLAFYKGFIPSYLRLGPWNIIFFITYEKLKVLF